MFSLNGKKAVVTGGGSGIGQAIAITLAKQGAEVHIIEVNEPQTAATMQLIAKNGDKCYSYACNVAEQGEVLKTFNQIGTTPFVDGFLVKNYPDQIPELFERLAKSQPIGRMGNPEEVAALALFLCSNEASFITRCDYPIDGGFTTLNN